MTTLAFAIVVIYYVSFGMLGGYLRSFVRPRINSVQIGISSTIILYLYVFARHIEIYIIYRIAMPDDQWSFVWPLLFGLGMGIGSEIGKNLHLHPGA